MLGRRTFIASAVLLITTVCLPAAEPDYFPLQVGNTWVLRPTRGTISDVRVVEVTGTTPIEDKTYYNVRWLFGKDALLRMTADGSLVAYDRDAKIENTWVAFGAPEGETFPTQIDPCDKSGKIESKSATYK